MTISKENTGNNPAETQDEAAALSDNRELASEKIRHAFDDAMQYGQTEDASEPTPQKEFVDRRKRSPNVNPFNKGVSALGDRRKAKMISTDKLHRTITDGVID